MKNILIIIKPHPFQNQLPIFEQKYSHIIICNNNDLETNGIELYELLGQVDVLLTDYSSVYFDFLLTQKPIGFILDDLKEYGGKRGFVVENPLELMPGEKIYDYTGLIRFLDDILNGKDDFKEERKRINDLANKYQNANNCKRICDFLGIKK